jgi:PEP-CTERM motif
MQNFTYVTIRALLAAGAAMWCGQSAAAGVHADITVTTFGGVSADDNRQTTKVPGERLSFTGSGYSEAYDQATGDLYGSARAGVQAIAEASFGVGRINVSAGMAYFVGGNGFQSFQALAASNAQANTVWTDEWTAVSATADPYAPTTISVRGHVNGSINTHGKYGQFGLFPADDQIRDARAAIGTFFSFSLGGGGVTISDEKFDEAILFANGVENVFSIGWEVSFTTNAGSPFSVHSFFGADSGSSNLSSCRFSTVGTCVQSATLTSLFSSTVDAITLSDGATLVSESGALFYSDGGYYYAAAVPEPGSVGLMLAGLALLFASRKWARGASNGSAPP